jgi:transcriptional regulator with XRE-family HTH domain
MPTDEFRLPLMPILPWQRPPTTRNRKGQWMPGICGNPKGRPTNARLRAKRTAAGSYVERLKRAASYAGLTPEQFVRLARIAYGKCWQRQLAADLGMSARGVIRWAKGDYNISHDKEMRILTVCLRRVRAAHALVRAMYRRAAAAERAREELASMPRHRVLTHPGVRGRDY